MFGSDFNLMLYVRDVARSAAFYHDALGFDFQGWWSDERQAHVKDWTDAGRPGYAELSAGPLKVSLHASDEVVRTGGAMFHLKVANVDEYYGRVRDKGIDVSAPKDEPWGWRMITVTDPDGHEWGFYTA